MIGNIIFLYRSNFPLNQLPYFYLSFSEHYHLGITVISKSSWKTHSLLLFFDSQIYETIPPDVLIALLAHLLYKPGLPNININLLN